MTVTSLALSREDAAALVGVSPILFDEMVRDRWMPPPLAHCDPPAWSRALILRAMDRVSAPAKPTTKGRIYVAGFANYVKIGFSRNVVARISALESGLPERLHLYSIQDGLLLDERRLHRHFDADRLCGEWFRKSVAISAWIDGGCDMLRPARGPSLFKPHKSRLAEGGI